jgi:hypothetical protein
MSPPAMSESDRGFAFGSGSEGAGPVADVPEGAGAELPTAPEGTVAARADVAVDVVADPGPDVVSPDVVSVVLHDRLNDRVLHDRVLHDRSSAVRTGSALTPHLSRLATTGSLASKRRHR